VSGESSPTAAARRPQRARRRRWLAPPRTLRPTRAGWVFFAFTLGVGLAALNTGNNLLYMIHALLLAFLVLSGVLSESALRGIRVRRILPAELVAERAGAIALEIRNAQSRIPAFAIVAEDFASTGASELEEAGRAFALRIEPGGCETRSYAYAPLRRGVLELSGVRVSTRFPFGLFSKATWIDLPQPALVYPALDPLEVRPGPASAPREAERSGGSGGAAAEASSLRPYAPGDVLRRIHWRASLRRGALMLRQSERDDGSAVTVRLATRGVAPGEAFERELRRAASEVAARLAAGQRVGLRTDGAAFPPEAGSPQRARLLGFLATLEPERAERAA
jgi:uncharacterized protein (DUF58 family)